jgi:hypothetical protein
MAEFFIGGFLGMILGSFLLTIGGETHETIVGKGYGIYCPHNGKFAFTGECNND